MLTSSTSGERTSAVGCSAVSAIARNGSQIDQASTLSLAKAAAASAGGR